MKIEWLNEALTRALIVRRKWPRFWKKESAFVCYRLFSGYCYWFYEDFKEAGLEGMVEGHCDTGSPPEHNKYALPYFSLARKLFKTQDDEEYFPRQDRKRDVRKQLEAAREEKNPWKEPTTLPEMKAIRQASKPFNFNPRSPK